MGPGISAILPSDLSPAEHAERLHEVVVACGVPRIREWVVRWSGVARLEDGAVELTPDRTRPLDGALASTLQAGQQRHTLSGSHDEVMWLFPEDVDLVLPGLGARRRAAQLDEVCLSLAGAEELLAELTTTRAELADAGSPPERLAWIDAGLDALAFACEHTVALSCSWSRALPR